MAQTQVMLLLRAHGGRRRRAGRKPKGQKALVSHLARPQFDRITPAHVTMRIGDDVPSLRSSRRFAVIRQCFTASRGKFGLRLVEFSVLSNHLHLVVEADSSKSLSRGMQGLNIRLAKALNSALNRSGRVFADHYHSRLLSTPTEVATAICYVLENAEHHDGEEGEDPCCSTSAQSAAAAAEPQGWLLRIGWQRGRWPGRGPPRGTRYRALPR
jgi:REP element-mobilizing transposase RayT